MNEKNAALSKTLISLLKGVVERDTNLKHWEMLLSNNVQSVYTQNIFKSVKLINFDFLPAGGRNGLCETGLACRHRHPGGGWSCYGH